MNALQSGNGNQWINPGVQDYWTVYTNSPIGYGGFGTVFYATHSNGSKGACKRIDLGNWDVNVQNEVSILSQLNNDYIVKFYGHQYGVVDGTKHLFLFMEYLSGGSLHDKIKKEGRIPADKVLRYTYQILCGLEYLHSKPIIIHRDIKPANILFNNFDQLKLADFGLSKKLNGTLSRANTLLGTPNYMSPDVVMGRWSVGCVIYEMRKTRPPYNGLTIHEISLNLQSGRVPQLNDEEYRLNVLLQLMLTSEESMRLTASQLLQHSVFRVRSG